MIFEGYSLEKKSTIGMRFKKEIYLNDGLSYTLVNPFCRSTCSPIRHLRICIVNSHDDKYKKKAKRPCNTGKNIYSKTFKINFKTI